MDSEPSYFEKWEEEVNSSTKETEKEQLESGRKLRECHHENQGKFLEGSTVKVVKEMNTEYKFDLVSFERIKPEGKI